LNEPSSCDGEGIKPTLEGHSPLAHKFTGGESGSSYSAMAWINCANDGGSWSNVWHLSPTDKNTPRNPSLYFHVS